MSTYFLFICCNVLIKMEMYIKNNNCIQRFSRWHYTTFYTALLYSTVTMEYTCKIVDEIPTWTRLAQNEMSWVLKFRLPWCWVLHLVVQIGFRSGFFFVSIGGGITFQETTQYNKKQKLNKKTTITTNKHPRKQTSTQGKTNKNCLFHYRLNYCLSLLVPKKDDTHCNSKAGANLRAVGKCRHHFFSSLRYREICCKLFLFIVLDLVLALEVCFDTVQTD
jgi:hypothetical protein